MIKSVVTDGKITKASVLELYQRVIIAEEEVTPVFVYEFFDKYGWLVPKKDLILKLAREFEIL